MSRLPPSLLYLAIYNPTLQPSGPIADDNEDAEEQAAHTLLYLQGTRRVQRSHAEADRTGKSTHQLR